VYDRSDLDAFGARAHTVLTTDSYHLTESRHE
jgi:hypothetical protein